MTPPTRPMVVYIWGNLPAAGRHPPDPLPEGSIPLDSLDKDLFRTSLGTFLKRLIAVMAEEHQRQRLVVARNAAALGYLGVHTPRLVEPAPAHLARSLVVLVQRPGADYADIVSFGQPAPLDARYSAAALFSSSRVVTRPSSRADFSSRSASPTRGPWGNPMEIRSPPLRIGFT